MEEAAEELDLNKVNKDKEKGVLYCTDANAHGFSLLPAPLVSKGAGLCLEGMKLCLKEQ